MTGMLLVVRGNGLMGQRRVTDAGNKWGGVLLRVCYCVFGV